MLPLPLPLLSVSDASSSAPSDADWVDWLELPSLDVNGGFSLGSLRFFVEVARRRDFCDCSLRDGTSER